MASGTKLSVADLLSPVCCKVGPPLIGLVFLAHPTDAQLDLKLNITPKSEL